MKKLIIFMSILTIFTGCGEKKDKLDDSKENNSTTVTRSMTSEVTSTDEVSTHLTTSLPTKNSERETTTTSKTTLASNVTTKKTTLKTTKKTSGSTTIKATTANSTTKATAASKLTEKDVYNKMIALKRKYPNGTKYDNSMCYEWKGASATRGCGCAGFAFMLSDAAFGNIKAKKHTDISKIHVGDIIRLYNDTHSVIVLEVNSTGVTVAEGNMTIVGSFENGVYWGRKISKDDLKSDVDYIYTRW